MGILELTKCWLFHGMVVLVGSSSELMIREHLPATCWDLKNSIYSSKQPSKAGVIIIIFTLLQSRKLKLGDAQWLAEGHTALWSDPQIQTFPKISHCLPSELKRKYANTSASKSPVLGDAKHEFEQMSAERNYMLVTELKFLFGQITYSSRENESLKCLLFLAKQSFVCYQKKVNSEVI